MAQAVRDRPDAVGESSVYHKLVRYHAAGCVSPPQWIGEAQRNHIGGAVIGRRLVLEIREAAFVEEERVGQPSLQEEPEPPVAPSSGPDQPLESVLARTHYFPLMSSRSVSPWSRSILNCVSVAVR